MAIGANDFIINNSIIRGLNPKDEDTIISILDSYLVPHLWSADFNGSTSTENNADLHFLTGSLESKIKQYIQEATGRNFDLITDSAELGEIQRARTRLNEMGRKSERI